MGDKVLVLLIGTNPLPNYVVGSYLKENYNKFVLIYSEENQGINQNGTCDFAKKLKEHLNLNDKYVFLPLSNVSDSKQIRKDLNNLFPNDNFEEIHLNYTVIWHKNNGSAYL
ncbi:hypothetical protein [Aceticella autotrophica]|uniref:hypothetical protein n=1 Tax=Aceticella autotrophica TaxID=2755338 RepID=UPI0025437711|nr:hypothetical protein [Aceticella autotrophica]